MSEKVDRLLSQFGLLSEEERQEFSERWSTADVFDKTLVPGSFENLKIRSQAVADELAALRQEAAMLSLNEQKSLEQFSKQAMLFASTGIGRDDPIEHGGAVFRLRSEFCTWVGTQVQFDRLAMASLCADYVLIRNDLQNNKGDKALLYHRTGNIATLVVLRPDDSKEEFEALPIDGQRTYWMQSLAGILRDGQSQTEEGRAYLARVDSLAVKMAESIEAALPDEIPLLIERLMREAMQAG